MSQAPSAGAGRGLLHEPVLDNTDDDIIGKINDGQHSVAELETAVADYFKHVHILEARLRQLRDKIIRAFEGKHADGAAEITTQQERIKRLNQRARKTRKLTTPTRSA